MSAHRSKRQFAGDAAQCSITAYFSPLSSSSSSSPFSASSDSQDFRPAPPTRIQSNLLNVGMRVRKSVPEGYKTGKEIIGIGPFTNNAKSISRGGGGVPLAASSARTANAPIPAPASRATAELQPFCGLHKVGGYMAQPSSLSDAFHDVPGLDDVPGLSLSQGTSRDHTEEIDMDVDDNDDDDDAIAGLRGRTSRKRVISDEEEDEDEADGNRILALGQHHADSAMRPEGRPIALPRQRKNGVLVADSRSRREDFEDAEFLDAGVYGP